MNMCKYCNIPLEPIPEPRQSKLRKSLQEYSIKFSIPIMGCPKCEWNRHFGRPMTVEVLQEKFSTIYREYDDMKVKELINILKQYDPQLPVYSSFDDGCCQFQLEGHHIRKERADNSTGCPERISIGN